MTTRMLRRGLPRVPGGEPWPPADAAADVAEVEVPAADAAPPTTVPATLNAPSVPAETDTPDSAPLTAAAAAAPVAAAAAAAAAAPSLGGASGIRRGLPRVVGGEPWPPADVGSAPPRAAADPVPVVATSTDASPAQAAASQAPSAPAPVAPAVAPAAAASSESTSSNDTAVRRGLPRKIGGEPWPPAGTLPAVADVSSRSASPSSLNDQQPAAEGASASPSAPEGQGASLIPAASTPASTALLGPDINTPLPSPSTAWNGRAPRHIPAGAASARRRPTWPQAIAALMGAAALGVIAGAAIAFVRTLLSFPFMQDFLAAFPGEYEPAIAVAPGFAPWIGWQHFFNAFLIVLIIRSGLTIRSEKRPTAFWTPRNNPKGKVSLTIWFHQALDILWLVNGVIFIVLLFVTGHWLRIVPTSWEVFPNALSAALQYVSFDWPTEHGWANYNSLQQLAYFATVFIAAPLAAVTGFRMSGMWPKKAERLSKAYPIEWARAVHFPVMIYFVVFIIGHVALVFLTGFLRNLNHMYASSDAATWTGFWVFVASLVVIAAGWAAARPLVLAPIAKLFGNVSSR